MSERIKRSRKKVCVLVCNSIFIRIYKKCTDHDVAGGLEVTLISKKHKCDLNNEQFSTFQHFRMFRGSSLTDYFIPCEKGPTLTPRVAAHDRLDSH